MSSFKELFKLCNEAPIQALQIIDKHAGCYELYPTDRAALYLLGILSGLLSAKRTHPDLVLKRVCEQHAGLAEFKPSDVLGDKRVYGKLGRRHPNPGDDGA